MNLEKWGYSENLPGIYFENLEEEDESEYSIKFAFRKILVKALKEIGAIDNSEAKKLLGLGSEEEDRYYLETVLERLIEKVNPYGLFVKGEHIVITSSFVEQLKKEMPTFSGGLKNVADYFETASYTTVRVGKSVVRAVKVKLNDFVKFLLS